MKTPAIFAFTDCKDQNALTRLSARLTALFEGSSINTVGITADIEAAGCILDTLDALRAGKGPYIIIGNLAPRTDTHYKNGAPFYVGYVGDTIIVATKTCFSLLFKFGIIDKIYETDVETVCSVFLSTEETARISNSQFRSFEYVPLLSLWAFEGKEIPNIETVLPVSEDNKVWWIDNFGNVKTTMTDKEAQEKVDDASIMLTIGTTEHTLPFFERLADVPKGTLACIIGSSGYKNMRFAEIVEQGGKASQTLSITVGDHVS